MAFHAYADIAHTIVGIFFIKFSRILVWWTSFGFVKRSLLFIHSFIQSVVCCATLTKACIYLCANTCSRHDIENTVSAYWHCVRALVRSCSLPRCSVKFICVILLCTVAAPTMASYQITLSISCNLIAVYSALHCTTHLFEFGLVWRILYYFFWRL